MVNIKAFSKVKKFQSGRYKFIFSINFIKFILPFLVILVLTISFLSFYSPWILHRDEFGVKKWFPNPIYFIKKNIKNAITQNIAAIINVAVATEYERNNTIPRINIFVPDNALEELDYKNFFYNLGDFTKRPRIKGYYKSIKNNKNPIPVYINLRGLGSHHHQIWKPSLKIRFRKKIIIDGHRDHVVIAPEDGIGMRNWISSVLSKKKGLLSNGEHFVRLFINNKDVGLYNRLWKLNESLLIQSKKLPGPFFRLELLSKRDFFRFKKYWFEPDGWEVIGESPSEGYKVIFRIISNAQLITRWTPKNKRIDLIKNIKILNEMLERNSFAIYLSLLSHAFGKHVDDYHNNAFWLDTTSGKLNPILIDVMGYGMGGHTVTSSDSIIKKNGAFVQAWLRDPRNLALYVKKLYKLVRTIGSFREMNVLLQNHWKIIKKELSSDIYLSKVGNPRDIFPITKITDNYQKILQFIKQRNNLINKGLVSTKISVTKHLNNGFEILVQGLPGINITKNNGKSFQIFGYEPHLSATETLALIPKKVTQLELLPSFAFETKNKNKELFYSFFWVSGTPNEYSFFNSLTKQSLKLSPPPADLKFMRIHAGVNMLSFKIQNSDPVVLGPETVYIKERKTYNDNQPVFIHAGTRILLGPGASLIIKGKLTINGNKTQPVTIRPENPLNPYGVIAIYGPNTKGTKINYLDMKGGSIDRIHNLKFSGMLSIHDCPDIEITNSRFGANYKGDDAVHIVRSNAKISNSIFINSYLDALDFDLVKGKISDSKFIKPGNDGIDLSMSDMDLINLDFAECKDKCLSIGEGSNISGEFLNFKNCETGVAIKDRSQLALNSSSFQSCKVAMHAFRKKWRWEIGGTVGLSNIDFHHSIEADILGDKFSQITIGNNISKILSVKGNVNIKS